MVDVGDVLCPFDRELVNNGAAAAFIVCHVVRLSPHEHADYRAVLIEDAAARVASKRVGGRFKVFIVAGRTGVSNGASSIYLGRQAIWKAYHQERLA